MASEHGHRPLAVLSGGRARARQCQLGADVVVQRELVEQLGVGAKDRPEVVAIPRAC
jgi:hypothetical protein